MEGGGGVWCRAVQDAGRAFKNVLEGISVDDGRVCVCACTCVCACVCVCSCVSRGDVTATKAEGNS